MKRRFRQLPALLALTLACSFSANAQPSTDTNEDAADGELGCIEIEVNGERIPDYDCLGRALAAPPSASHGRPPAQFGAREIAGRPPTQLGLAPPEATRQRMGNTFGISTQPQRPEVPPPTLPPTIKRP